MNVPKHLTLALSVVTLAVSVGCLKLKPRTDTTRFYVLGDGTGPSLSPPSQCARTVLIGPVRVASHIDQPTIIERVGANEVRPLEWHRWAELPGRSLPPALVTRLAGRLPDTCVISYARSTPGTNSLQVEVEIDRFELASDKQALLAARWRIFTPGLDKRDAQGAGRFVQAFTSGTNRVAAGVAALTETIDQLAKQLADDLRVQ